MCVAVGRAALTRTVSYHRVGVEPAVPVLVAGVGQLRGQVGILDHPHLAVGDDEVAYALEIVGLGYGLAGHL